MRKSITRTIHTVKTVAQDCRDIVAVAVAMARHNEAECFFRLSRFMRRHELRRTAAPPNR